MAFRTARRLFLLEEPGGTAGLGKGSAELRQSGGPDGSDSGTNLVGCGCDLLVDEAQSFPTGSAGLGVTGMVAPEVADAAVPATAVRFDQQHGVEVGEVRELLPQVMPWQGELTHGLGQPGHGQGSEETLLQLALRGHVPRTSFVQHLAGSRDPTFTVPCNLGKARPDFSKRDPPGNHQFIENATEVDPTELRREVNDGTRGSGHSETVDIGEVLWCQIVDLVNHCSRHATVPMVRHRQRDRVTSQPRGIDALEKQRCLMRDRYVLNDSTAPTCRQHGKPHILLPGRGDTCQGIHTRMNPPPPPRTHPTPDAAVAEPCIHRLDAADAARLPAGQQLDSCFRRCLHNRTECQQPVAFLALGWEEWAFEPFCRPCLMFPVEMAYRTARRLLLLPTIHALRSTTS